MSLWALFQLSLYSLSWDSSTFASRDVGQLDSYCAACLQGDRMDLESWLLWERATDRACWEVSARLHSSPIKGLRHSSFSLILLCVGHFRCTIILRSTLQSWFHYPHFIKEGTQTPINNFLMVTHTTISGRVGVRLKLQSWDSKACVLSIPVCVREEGNFLKSYFGKIECMGQQKKPKSFKSRFLYF